MISRDQSVIVEISIRVMVPVIQIFAFYVIFHGHYSPGGGFQGGALLAGSVLLQRVVLGQQLSQAGFACKLALPLGALGVMIYLGTGLLAYIQGGNFLQYDEIPLPFDAHTLRNIGILLVEVGVAFAVMATLISIFDDLSGGQSEDDSESLDEVGEETMT